jgi:arylsulfotransferase ASST/type IX secretion system substrate protein/Big-like domain-containing protein
MRMIKNSIEKFIKNRRLISLIRMILNTKTGIFIILVLVFNYKNFSQNIQSSNPYSKSEYISIPKFNITKNLDPISGYIFTNIAHNHITNKGFVFILDSYGTPIFYRSLPTTSYDFKLQPNGYLTYHDSQSRVFYVLDSAYTIIDTLRAKNSFKTDIHDLIITPDNFIYLIATENKIIDMSAIVEGGNENTTVTGAIIQKLNTNDEVLFEWKSWDHFEITDTYQNINSSTIDYVHANSIFLDTDSTLIISCRNMDEITKISLNNGNIIWRLGGKNNEFSLPINDRGFSGQHAVSIINNETLLLYDNGNNFEDGYSRGVQYKINEQDKSLTLIKEYRHIPDINAPRYGNIIQYNNEKIGLNWGGNITSDVLYSEYNSTGNLIYEIEIADTNPPNYRAFRFPWKTNVFYPNKDTIIFKLNEEKESVKFEEKITLFNNSTKPLIINNLLLNDSTFSVTKNIPFIIESQENDTITVSFYSDSIYTFNDVLTICSDSNTVDFNQRIAIQVHLKIDTIIDTKPPTVSINPIFGFIPVDTIFKATFSEPIRNIDDTEINSSHLSEIIKLVENNVTDSLLEISATINHSKNEVTFHPLTDLKSSKEYSIVVKNIIEDFNNNVFQEKIFSFTTELIDTTAPILNLFPLNNNIPVDTFFTITANEPLRNIDNSVLTKENIYSFVSINQYNNPEKEIPYTTYINSQYDSILLFPQALFIGNTEYVISLKDSIEDFFNNRIPQNEFIFKTELIIDTIKPTVDIYPFENIPIDTFFTAIFSEPIVNLNNTDIIDNTISSIVTFKKLNNENSIDIVGNINLKKDIINFSTVQQLDFNETYLITISNVQDNYNNLLEETSFTVTTQIIDTIKPYITFFPNIDTIPIDTRLKIVFNEPVRFIENTEIVNESIQEFIKLFENDTLGEIINFDATIDSQKKVVEIIPDSLKINQEYCLKIESKIEDFYDNIFQDTTFYFKTTSTAISENLLKKNEVIIYPNPFLNEINIRTNEIFNIELFDIFGNKILQSNKAKINLEYLEKGIYIIHYYDINKRMTFKILHL